MRSCAHATPTLRDVATGAGVSIGTASNAFNRPDLISDQLRDRVLAEAKRLGYAGPDPAARRLRTGRAGALGLVFTDRLPFAFDDEAAVIFLRGVARALESSGAGLLLIPTSPTREEGARVVSEAAVDGFLVYSTPTGDPRLDAALERGLPTVVVDEPLEVHALHRDRRSGRREAAALICARWDTNAWGSWPFPSWPTPKARCSSTSPTSAWPVTEGPR